MRLYMGNILRVSKDRSDIRKTFEETAELFIDIKDVELSQQSHFKAALAVQANELL